MSPRVIKKTACLEEPQSAAAQMGGQPQGRKNTAAGAAPRDWLLKEASGLLGPWATLVTWPMEPNCQVQRGDRRIRDRVGKGEGAVPAIGCGATLTVSG